MNAAPLKVLLIEDNPGDARLIREMLRGSTTCRFELEHVERLDLGLQRLAHESYAVVLLDLVLVETRGIETLRQVRDHFPALPVVVLTGSDDEFLAAEALQAGAQDYLIKGRVEPDMLSRSLRYAIERGRAEDELRRRADELAESGKRKDEFLAILSHELRNPLSPLIMAGEILRNPDITADDRRWAQGMIERQVRTMTRLIDDLLDISRISRGKIALRKTRMDLAQAVRHALEATDSLYQARGHARHVSLPDAPLWIFGDSVRVEQIVANLLTNAAKYTDSGGTVWLTAAAEGGQAVVSVRDTGVGIPPEMLDRVFDLFTQVDGSISRTAQWGMGIGLAIVRGLVDLHGGTITASSAGLGQGSRFTLSLPLLVDDSLPAAPAPPVPAAPEKSENAVRKILIVEDHTDSALSLERLLHAWRHEVRVVHSGQDALAAAPEFAPDVILLDIGMPGMDGYEVAKQLRRLPQFHNTFLLALTGYGRQEDRQRALEAGFNYHMTKPVDPETLRNILTTRAINP